ncbi:hypothetical protein KM043_010902 [Ampulex compressa]|nr:hypothetical protein KM043_010902 [Ampulex compressa]
MPPAVGRTSINAADVRQLENSQVAIEPWKGGDDRARRKKRSDEKVEKIAGAGRHPMAVTRGYMDARVFPPKFEGDRRKLGAKHDPGRAAKAWESRAIKLIRGPLHCTPGRVALRTLITNCKAPLLVEATVYTPLRENTRPQTAPPLPRNECSHTPIRGSEVTHTVEQKEQYRGTRGLSLASLKRYSSLQFAQEGNNTEDTLRGAAVILKGRSHEGTWE